MQRKYGDLQTTGIWFQQDGATSHTSFCFFTLVRENMFGQINIISYITRRVRLPHSPDLNPLDSFLLGLIFLKDRVHSPKPQSDTERTQKEHQILYLGVSY